MGNRKSGWKRYSYKEHISKHFKNADLGAFMQKYYIEKRYSDIDIINMIKARAGIKFTRTAIMKWHKKTTIPARNAHDRFMLAINMGKIDHRAIAKKANPKIANGLRGTSYLNSKPAPYLAKLLKSKGKSQAQLARHLGVTTGAVNAWCSQETAIYPKYWKSIRRFLGLPYKKIFVPSTRPVNSVRMLSGKLGTSRSNVYHWLSGANKPRNAHIRSIINNLYIAGGT